MRPGRKYPRGKYWKQQSEAAMKRAGKNCEVTGDPLRVHFIHTPPWKFTWRRAVHHIIGERWARKWVPGCDPHILENLIVVTPKYHAKLTAIENRLKNTDWLGFRTELYRWGFPLERLDAAFRALCENAKK